MSGICTQVSDCFPFKWINKKWKEGFYVTSMATSHTRWAVVMSRNAGFVDQCVELDFQYPSEGIHRRWDGGLRITACAATPDQAAFVLSVPRRRPVDETQETLRTSAFPSTHVKVSHANLVFVTVAVGNRDINMLRAPVNCRTNGRRTSTLLVLHMAAPSAETICTLRARLCHCQL